MSRSVGASLALLLLPLAACVQLEALQLDDSPHLAVPPESVRVFLRPPRGEYSEVAILKVNEFLRVESDASVLHRLRAQAGALGANGLLLAQRKPPAPTEHVEMKRDTATGSWTLERSQELPEIDLFEHVIAIRWSPEPPGDRSDDR